MLHCQSLGKFLTGSKFILVDLPNRWSVVPMYPSHTGQLVRTFTPNWVSNAWFNVHPRKGISRRSILSVPVVPLSLPEFVASLNSCSVIYHYHYFTSEYNIITSGATPSPRQHTIVASKGDCFVRACNHWRRYKSTVNLS